MCASMCLLIHIINVYTLHCVVSCVSIIDLIYFSLDDGNVSAVLLGASVPAPLADDVSEDNAELRRNLPPSPGAATCSASTIPALNPAQLISSAV